ncbi:META domain-containing protein [Cellulomonas sp. NPDC055163]
MADAAGVHGRDVRGPLVGAVMLLLGLAGVLSACSGAAAGGADLAGKTFVSTAVAGHELVPGSEVTMTFESDRMSVNAGCNTMSGEATWQDGTLEVAEPLAATMMACPDDLTQQDEWLRTFLTSEPLLRLDGSTLELGDSDDGLTLEEQ